MAFDGSIRINTKIDSKGFNSGVKSMMGSLGNLAASLGIVFGVAAIVNFGKKSVETATIMEAGWQGLSYMARAYGRDLVEIKGFLQEYVADGLVPMINAQQAYKNLVAYGFNAKEIEDMLNVMKDSSVFLRKNQLLIGEAIEKTTMGIRTERSILTDSSGIEQNMYKMWQGYAQEHGTTIAALTKAEKIAAVYQGFMREGAISAGAAAVYTQTYAGKVAQLSAAMISFKVSVGNAVIPILGAIIPFVRNAIIWLTKLFNSIGRVMNVLFGSKIGMVDAEAAIAGSAQDTADATGQTAANTEAAGKAAKNALASFDKLNVLAQATASGSGGTPGGGGVGGIGGGMEDPSPIVLTDIEQYWVTAFQEMGKGFKSLYTEVIKPVYDAFAGSESWLNVHFFTPVGETAIKVWGDIKEGGEQAAIGIKTGDWSGFASWWNTTVAAPLAEKTATTWEDVKKGAGLAWVGIKTGDWSGAAKWFEDAVLIPTADKFNFKWNGAGGIKETVGGVLQTIKTDWQPVSEWYATNVLNPLAAKFGSTWTGPDGVTNQSKAGKEEMQKQWGTVAQWFEDNVYKNIIGGWKLVIEAFKGGLQSGELMIGTSIISAINTFAGAVNTTFANMQRTINNWIADVKNAFGFLANGLKYINLPQIGLLDTGSSSYFQDSPYPHGAAGMVLPPNAPFAAIVGDQRSGTNIETPEKLLRQIMREEMGGRQSQEGMIHNVIKLDSQVLYDGYKKVDRRIGGSLAMKAGAA